MIYLLVQVYLKHNAFWNIESNVSGSCAGLKNKVVCDVSIEIPNEYQTNFPSIISNYVP